MNWSAPARRRVTLSLEPSDVATKKVVGQFDGSLNRLTESARVPSFKLRFYNRERGDGSFLFNIENDPPLEEILREIIERHEQVLCITCWTNSPAL